MRVFNNFLDASANDNTTPDPSFPGATGAPLAIWKGIVEWGSELHGDGSGDPTQPFDLGSGGANFDPSWQGNATEIGNANANTFSTITTSPFGIYSYTEFPSTDGWRIHRRSTTFLRKHGGFDSGRQHDPLAAPDGPE